MANWAFNENDPSSVRIEVTQRDQFNNDDVDLAEALVREVIQNSSDAGDKAGQPVKVRFALTTLSGSQAEWFSGQFEALRPHLKACGVDDAPLSQGSLRVLSIEDFNTKGLTGSFDDIDGDNFDRFWRSVGESAKSGKSGGRWGLGKLVYSSSSKLRAFFGLTLREGDSGPALMGQAVLKNHKLGKKLHPAHGFWFDHRDAESNLQLPVTDQAEIEAFSKLAGLSRSGQRGLSLVIPWPLDSIDEDTLIDGVLRNYYFPILAGRLVIEVGNVTISRGTFMEVATKRPLGNIPFNFVKKISDTVSVSPSITAKSPISNSGLTAEHFTPEQLADMKETFACGETVRARVPVVVKPKNEPDRTTYIELYLQSLPEGAKQFALIARGPITLPGERRFFGSASAYGALIANDEAVAAFLGDAENPAHTGWNPHAEKLGPNWRSAPAILTSIRQSLHTLYGLVAKHAEKEDPDALLDFFSVLDKAQAARGKKKKTPKVVVNVPKREKELTIISRSGGFDIAPGSAAENWTFPKTLRVRMAYDMIGANPFNRHSRYDFDLEKGNEIEVEATNASCEAVKPNILKVVAESPDFLVKVSGFDERRDVIVDARTV